MYDNREKKDQGELEAEITALANAILTDSPNELKDHYTEDTWHGIPRYRCNHCPFGTVHFRDYKIGMIEHIVTKHMETTREVIVTSAVIGPNGQPLQKRMEAKRW